MNACPIVRPSVLLNCSPFRGIARRRGSIGAAALAIAFVLALGAPRSAAAEDEAITFNDDIRPILADKCFFCHGPDKNKRESGLRLDTREGAIFDEHMAIVPGKPDESEMIRRIESTDDDERMPPLESGKKLSKKQIKLLREWIAAGAEWQPLWSYMPLERPELPKKKAQESFNPIDDFVAARLARMKLHMSPEADRRTLIRRLSFDLTGLPPTPEEVDAFVNDASPDAYEQLVDRLLASPHYGERMAIYWLDLVRYADTVGYHGDQEHNIAPYRNYVISAFNHNVPFDQFSRDQLAGDLLPKPSLEQKIATGYNRVLQTSHEGGVQPKEYMAIYSADHVRNFANVWLAGTMGCSQCHDHKFDPYTMKDFYSLAAFFADIDENYHLGHGTNNNPTERAPELSLPNSEQKKELATLRARHKALKDQQRAEEEKTKKEAEAAELASADDASPDASVGNTGGADSSDEQPKAKSKRKRRSKDDKASEEPQTPLEKEITEVEQKIRELRGEIPRTMITKHMKPRTIRILPRGNWLDESGDVVEPAVPEFLGVIEVGDRRPTRLDLANWLFDTEDGNAPLTSRVMVNRLWYLMFGRGLSGSLDDFGVQGEVPSNPQLLEFLSSEFIASGWDIKHVLKLIAMSRTYRQSSAEVPELIERDPLNQHFARQSHFRLPAEMVRDTALTVSGLLVDSVDGATARPYQPAGYYRHLNFPEREYQSDSDDKQWRRGVYMHWQRQYLHPMLKAFDAPSREECTAQRTRSNTPVAALVLLNDPSFVEAARMFAARILESDQKEAAGRVDFAFREAVSRKADADEHQLLEKLVDDSRQYYADHPDEADKLLRIGLKPVPAGLDHQELAAWTVVARTILSMNETMTRN